MRMSLGKISVQEYSPIDCMCIIFSASLLLAT